MSKDKLISVQESTAVKLLENLGQYPAGTKFVYRNESWYYPEYDYGVPPLDGMGDSGLWYVGVTREEVSQWMYGLLLRADFYKGKDHRLKELFELEFKL